VRSRYLDTLKGITIILVVFFHCLKATQGAAFESNKIANILQPFLVPVFFLVAGYLSHNVTIIRVQQYLKGRAYRLLVPHVVLDILWLGAGLIGTAIDSVRIRDMGVGTWTVRCLTGGDGEIFFLALFVVQVVLVNLRTVESHGSTKAFWIYLLITSCFIELLPSMGVWIGQVQWYYLFATLGFLLAKYSGILKSNGFRIVVILGAVSYLPILWLTHWNGGWLTRPLDGALLWLYYHNYITAPVVAVQVLTGICVIAVIAYVLRSSILSLVGQYSLVVYFLHLLVCRIAIGTGPVRVLTAFIVTSVICTVLILVLRRVSWLQVWIPRHLKTY
jgi:fucose 4-O-acetylase-like acetyltransferase